MRTRFLCALAVTLTVVMTTAPRGADEPKGEWRTYAGTNAGSKYSPLDQINKDNVKNLRIVWRQSSVPVEVRKGRSTVALPTNYQVTPLMVGGLLYATAGDSSIVALNPATGRVVWTYVPPELQQAEPTSGNEPAKEVLAGRTGNRGLAYWTDGTDARIVGISGQSLIALNAKTGALTPDFGTGGRVDLTKGYRRPAASIRWTSMPVIVKDVIVIGGMANGSDGAQMPGDIRAYDVRTGKPAWTFKVIPEFGEFGNDTWLKDSYAYAGASGVWGLMSADDELGYLYVATETPTAQGGDFWGGKRPGSNLFAESLVCIDARTGKRVWHFQGIHHGIWDYDFTSAPNLLDITVNGRRIKAIAEVSKQAFTYVLDRVTGQPIWPIDERPVSAGNVPGEWYAPTQPHPSKPPAFDQQGVTIDDLIDFTPELRQEAITILNQYRYGPLFTPPTVAADGKKGTVQMPGAVGGANWTGAAADPDTGILYVTSVKSPFIAEMVRTVDLPAQPPAGQGAGAAGQAAGAAPNVPGAAAGAPPQPQAPPAEWRNRPGPAVTGAWLEGPQGLPIFKPPYGRLTAIDLNKGEILWTAANGNGPRDHAAIKHLNLPPLGQPGRAAVLVTKSMLFLGEGGNNGVVALPPFGGGKMFRSYDKATGKVLWEIELPAGTTGAPMTYMFNGKQYIVVAVGWKDVASEFVALALP